MNKNMQKIIPCLWFVKDCEEAINFYVSVFNSAPGKRAESRVASIDRYPEGIKDAPWSPDMAGKVITAIFELDGQRFMALDGGPGVFQPSGVVSFLIECDTQEEVDHFWNKLKEGGDPNAQQCGWLADKYGFAWQVAPKVLGELLSDPDKAKANRAMEAMLKMKKLDIAELRKAYEGK
jgi:predicted 3-demethylubiquinone-9 3-methyltransferase (glyoxalase superfamily)